MKAVIMAGGQGTRFWPASREDHPKQFLQIASPKSMLQETVARLEPLLNSEDIYVVCGRMYRENVREQLEQIPEEQIIVEPVARNTAPCVGLAALRLKRYFEQETMAILPSDHVIEDVGEFHEMLRAAEEAAREGWLVTFAIEPTYPATGYGYLRRGEKIGHFSGQATYRVERFTEKPEKARAQKFLKEGSYYWNSGMFLWSVSTILEEIQTHMPGLYQALQEIDQHRDDVSRTAEIFARLESISIDYGIMEKAKRVAMIPCRLGWNDVGNWRALEEICDPDPDGITSNTRYLSIESRDCIVYATPESPEKLVALLGVKDLVVVETSDAVLVCSRDRTEDVRQIVEGLRGRGWKEYL